MRRAFLVFAIGFVLGGQSNDSGVQRVRSWSYWTIDRFDDGANTCYVISAKFNYNPSGISCVVRTR